MSGLIGRVAGSVTSLAGSLLSSFALHSCQSQQSVPTSSVTMFSHARAPPRHTLTAHTDNPLSLLGLLSLLLYEKVCFKAVGWHHHFMTLNLGLRYWNNCLLWKWFGSGDCRSFLSRMGIMSSLLKSPNQTTISHKVIRVHHYQCLS